MILLEPSTHTLSPLGPTFLAVRSHGGVKTTGGVPQKFAAQRGQARGWIGVVGPAGIQEAVLIKTGMTNREASMHAFAKHALELLEGALLRGQVARL